ncbi:MFS transporter [Bradyrhizobium sp. 147]|uniref:Cmx/CmrA family chloramphenicol efflux MFS transporter n=1 Tax=Bradyrhizobium sp. 147 TaxID=2782623 RepID=UPI001FF7E39B|nr:Cmx/CmrA family chloramphenicol efflux MFS transporter [Bradyrhizobium sp. 147]MCK1680970.1 MFS transporter [Bradyrhizobium sp. 147]
MPAAVYILGLSIFCLGTTEFMISGLLPHLAREFDVSIASAGLLISAFALAVAIGAPPLSILGLRLRRKIALLVLLAVFTAGQILAASAQTYGWLMSARILTALAFGPFFAIGAVEAVDLVNEDRRARAIAVMFGGLTIANIAGVPAGAFIGEQWGWRGAFWVVAVLSAVALAGVAWKVPSRASALAGWSDLRSEFKPFSKLALWTAILTTALSQAALFAVFSYISPLLTEVAHLPSGAVPPLLVVFGVGTCIGSFIGGRLADRFLELNLMLGLVLLGAMTGVLAVATRNPVAMTMAIFAYGISAFAINPALQAQVMREAKAAPTLSSAANISAFNVGNTLGPLLGGALIAGHGYIAPIFVGVALATAALLASVLTWRMKVSQQWFA